MIRSINSLDITYPIKYSLLQAFVHRAHLLRSRKSFESQESHIISFIAGTFDSTCKSIQFIVFTRLDSTLIGTKKKSLQIRKKSLFNPLELLTRFTCSDESVNYRFLSLTSNQPK